MLNNASKFALGVAGLGVVAAIFADDRAAILVLVGVVVAAAIVAFGIARATGDDLEPFNAADAAPASTALDPADVGNPSVGPLLAAIGVTGGVAGGALGPYWVLSGGLVAALGVGLWLFDTFRTPGVVAARDAANLDNRFLGPLALPVVSFLVAITIAFCLSRVLLAVNETASWVLAFILAAALFAILALVAARTPQTNVTRALAGVGAVGVLASGVVFGGMGEREFHHAGEEIPTVEITAKDIAFDRKIIALPAETEAQIVFTNLDLGVYHNVALYTAEEPGAPIYNGAPSVDGTLVYKLRTPEPGTYRYICDFHPAMAGELRVSDAPVASDDHGDDHGEDEHDSSPVESSEDESSEHASEKESEH